MLIPGLLVLGVGIALMVRANLGLGPWDVFHQGISRHTGIPMGRTAIIVGVPIILLWWPLGYRPGIGTLINVVLVGLTIDVALDRISAPHLIVLRVPMLLGSIVVLAVGAGLYLGAGLGAGPRDGLMLALHNRFGWSIRLVRTVMEVTVLVCGVVLGGTAGFGTVLFAFTFGPLVQVTLGWFGAPRLAVEPVGLAGE